ncbi:MAG: sugar ABC transporter substrate-binding protein [Bacteroidetes bacterium SW_9_63_38]|nr:MAG: sugar ABC transporter substrate-binding protein [Bacteroidetes bacterium SW_9_63_38]
MRRLGAILCLCVTALLMLPVGPAVGQEVPDAVQQELDKRGMTLEQARQQMQQLGIDPSNPQQAAQRARELGVPEARIQALMQAAGAAGGQRTGVRTTGAGGPEVPDSVAALPLTPVVAGTPRIEPGSLSVRQLPVDVKAVVPLQSRSRITDVELGFLTADGDSAALRSISRTQGTTQDGQWRGYTTVPQDTNPGTWDLYATVTTADTTVTLPTGRQFTIRPKEKNRQSEQPRKELTYFGYDTFETIPEAFVPEATGPADGSYVVGPDDELRLTVWGGAEFAYELPVDREGRVTVPNVGQFTVAGKRLDTLRQEMKTWLSRSYSGLTSEPQTVFMDLTLTRIQPSRVFVLGEVPQPGGYTVSSYATVFNALYSVGGPLKRGSLRNIRVIRDGEVVSTVDLYDYLMEGYSPNSVQLQSNDYVFVPPRGKTVAIRGAVKRPAYYEMTEGETVQDLLEYAGGLEAEAYAKRFQIERIVPFDEREEPSVARKVIDVSLQDVRSDSVPVKLADGDRVRILSVAEAQSPAVQAQIEAVEVRGAVFQPGQYELGGGVRTVKDLIDAADGLRGDAYREQADLIRIDDSLDQTTQALDLNAVMDDAPQENVVLQPGDSLHIASVQEMEADRFVRISGKVRTPGRYRYRKGMTVRDLLIKGGGLTDEQYLKEVFLGRADLFRTSKDGDEKRVIPFHLGDALAGGEMSTRELRPGDEVRIYPATVDRLDGQFVKISGAVESGGKYTFRDNMTLKDLLLQANGFAEGASLREVEVTRMVEKRDEEGLRAKTIPVSLVDEELSPKGVNFSVEDTTAALEAAADFKLRHRDQVYVRKDPSFQPQETVTVQGEVRYPGEYTLLRDNERLSNLIDRSGGILPTGYLKGGRLTRDGEQVIVEMKQATQGDPEEDVILRPGDEIVIPTQPNTVAVRGNVANEGLIKHEDGRRVEYYLDRAGGTRKNTETTLITQASGATFRVDTGWFRRTPEVDDGAVIRVTKEEETDRSIAQYAQIASTSTQILSSAVTLLVLVTQVLN